MDLNVDIHSEGGRRTVSGSGQTPTLSTGALTCLDLCFLYLFSLSLPLFKKPFRISFALPRSTDYTRFIISIDYTQVTMYLHKTRCLVRSSWTFLKRLRRSKTNVAFSFLYFTLLYFLSFFFYIDLFIFYFHFHVKHLLDVFYANLTERRHGFRFDDDRREPFYRSILIFYDFKRDAISLDNIFFLPVPCFCILTVIVEYEKMIGTWWKRKGRLICYFD